ncbi:MAG: alpha/beta hydrolase [Spirochaetales bacterium]|nr:alpha/beta hydrolase [Spirochaetales bacterium]
MNSILTAIEQTIRKEAQSTEEKPRLIPSFLTTDTPLPCILICPGGGYGFTSPREAEPVARAYNEQGFHALVLHYRTEPHRHPSPLLDVSNTLSLLRKHAEELKINPERIILCGFSAGGHLTASLGCHWNKDFLQNGICRTPGQNRPDGLILCYPVISSGESAHRGSFDNLLGPDASPERLEMMSLEQQAGAHTPPAFLWHTADDEAVPVENSMLFSMALQKAKIPFELHIFPEGPHGLSLATEETDESGDGSMTIPHVQGWLELSARWVRSL